MSDKRLGQLIALAWTVLIIVTAFCVYDRWEAVSDYVTYYGDHQ